MLRADCAMPCCVPTAPCHAACRLCYSSVSPGGAANPVGVLALAGHLCTTCTSGKPMPGVPVDTPSGNGVCITSDSAVAAPDGTKIAGQCCEADGTCKRRTTNNNADCIFGIASDTASFVERTFAQTLAECSSRGLVMCEHMCTGTGCHYDNNYVWTGLACDGNPLALTPAGEPKLSTLTSLNSVLSPSVVLFSLSLLHLRNLPHHSHYNNFAFLKHQTHSVTLLTLYAVSLSEPLPALQFADLIPSGCLCAYRSCTCSCTNFFSNKFWAVDHWNKWRCEVEHSLRSRSDL